jgi:hypothetical protein
MNPNIIDTTEPKIFIEMHPSPHRIYLRTYTNTPKKYNCRN